MKLKNTQKMKGFTLVELLVVIAIIAVLAGIATPLILKAQKAGDRTKAIANAKSIASGLMSFNQEFNSYPSQTTGEDLKNQEKILPDGDNANTYLAQLIVSKTIDNEKVFFAPGVPGSKEGDNMTGDVDKILGRGENSFGYIMADNDQPLTETSSYTPLILAPIKAGSGSDEPTFSKGAYGEKYVMGLADGSAKAESIAESGIAMSEGRSSLFQTGPDSLFGDDTPVVKLPKMSGQ
jgi:prepilin-type N-terminal cleavage/methylation domain-containing protein